MSASTSMAAALIWCSPTTRTRPHRRALPVAQELSKLWMHNGMIQFTGEKMAKSVGNIALLHEVLSEYGPEAVVMYLISGHYRQPLAFSEAALEQAQANVKRIREAGRRLAEGDSPDELDGLRDRFFDALAADFNTAEALAGAQRVDRRGHQR